MKNYVDVKFKISKREYEIDIDKLRNLLITSKKESKLINQEIADILDVPKTMVDHWFRKDKYFSVPDKELWFDLKELLHIDTDEFDEPITKFIEQEGIYDMGNRVYTEDGLCPAIETNAKIKIYVKKDL